MLRHILAPALAIGSLLLFSSCVTMTRMPLTGMLYTGVKSGYSVTGLSKTSKMGEACGMSILGLVAMGDASIDTARRNGGIKKVAIVDENNTSFLFGLYSSYCIQVYGS